MIHSSKIKTKMKPSLIIINMLLIRNPPTRIWFIHNRCNKKYKIVGNFMVNDSFNYGIMFWQSSNIFSVIKIVIIMNQCCFNIFNINDLFLNNSFKSTRHNGIIYTYNIMIFCLLELGSLPAMYDQRVGHISRLRIKHIDGRQLLEIRFNRRFPKHHIAGAVASQQRLNITRIIC